MLEDLLSGRVRQDDVVVFQDPLTAVLARVVRERGAHAVWHLSLSAGPARRRAAEASAFVRRFAAPIDAYVLATSGDRRGRSLERLLAVMPAADRLATKEVEPWPARQRPRPDETLSDVGWISLLADVVDGDRGETVGGTRHARPTVAAR